MKFIKIAPNVIINLDNIVAIELNGKYISFKSDRQQFKINYNTEGIAVNEYDYYMTMLCNNE